MKDSEKNQKVINSGSFLLESYQKLLFIVDLDCS